MDSAGRAGLGHATGTGPGGPEPMHRGGRDRMACFASSQATRAGPNLRVVGGFRIWATAAEVVRRGLPCGWLQRPSRPS